ncbi:MAG: sodium:calcium antiporter [Verrucomicrobiota bacterium]|jgi:cation:H+ antiporter|nr:sodium:calcium antiporter [Verrucomicrobiota bacterium]
MMLSILYFGVGIALLWAGTEIVVRRIPRLAGWLRVSPLLLTILLVAIITSLPEFSVSLFASLRGQPSAAVGNIVGSNFVTLTFVAGFCALWRPIAVGRSIRLHEASWMILSSTVLLLVSLDGRINRLDGALLVAVYIPYFLHNLDDAKQQRRNTPVNVATARPGLDILLFLVGIGMVIWGADWIVNHGTAIAQRWGMSELLIGVTFYSIGTSLPELAIALGAILHRQSDVTLGEIYASNIFTGLVVVGVLCLIRPLPVEPIIVQRDLPMLIGVGIVMQIFVTTGNRFVRSEGLAMIAIYAFFLYAQFTGLQFILP